MKYLKKFEGKVLKDEIIEFCESHLTYLVDNGFHFIKSVSELNNCTYVFMRKIDKSKFNWEEVKYEFIPFLTLLNNNFNLGKFLIENPDGSKADLIFRSFGDISFAQKYEEVINDIDIYNSDLLSIDFIIKSKKSD